MPPKRKHTEDPAPTNATSMRTTRSSGRLSNLNNSNTSSSKLALVADPTDESTEIKTPPVKKTRATKAANTKAASAPKTTKQTTTKRVPKSSLKVADESGAIQSDDDVTARNKNVPEIATPTTINESIPVSTSAKGAHPPSLSGGNEPYTPARAQLLFKSYAESDDPTIIGPEGFQRLCADADIPLDGPLPLVLAWQFRTKEMMKITEREWQTGTESLRISNLHALSLAMRDLESVLIYNNVSLDKRAKKEAYDMSEYRKCCADAKGSFHKLYSFCFLLVKPEQSKNIDMEVATALWSVLLVPKYPLMVDVLGFIADNLTTYKAANKDLWGMMLEFCETVNPNLSDYEIEEAWPTLLDNFVLSKKAPPANGGAGD